MDFSNYNSALPKGVAEQMSDEVYMTIASGDIACAWLLLEQCKDKNSIVWHFNKAVCLFKMCDFAQALIELSKADLAMSRSVTARLDTITFKKALSINDNELYACLPMHTAIADNSAYCELRIKWLTALSNIKIGNKQDAIILARWLKDKYGIKSVESNQ